MRNWRMLWQEFRGRYSSAQMLYRSLFHDITFACIVFVGVTSFTIMWYPKLLPVLLGLEILPEFFERIPYLKMYIMLSALTLFATSVAQFYVFVTGTKKPLMRVFLALYVLLAATSLLGMYWKGF